jgi:hypothetical protein
MSAIIVSCVTAIETDRRRLNAQERSDEARQRGHRAACGPARDRGDGVALFDGGPLVRNEADRPVALAHRIRRQPENDEAETVERDGSVAAAVDLKGHGERARPLARFHHHLTQKTRTHEIAIACFVVLTDDLPCRRCHQCTSLNADCNLERSGIRRSVRAPAALPQL